MTDFSDRPLVAGSLIGLRAFGVDKLGRLTSVYHQTPFRPGVNEAECRKRAYGSGGMFLSGFPLTPSVSFARDPSDPSTLKGTITYAEEPEGESEHPGDVAGTKCSCGFYAYFDGSNGYKDSHRISGIIEGFGVCSLGERGFRASKARLVAIIAKANRVTPDQMARVAHNYPDAAIYATKREALEAHPLTPPEVPTPETDADFWTRSAS